MKKIIQILSASVMLALTGCTFTREQTTINTPAVFDVSTNAVGLLATNLVSPASVKQVTVKERLLLPEGYMLSQENDVFGIDVSLTSASSTLPNVRLGNFHNSLRLVPTSTNQIYAPKFTVSGSVDSKAAPFWNKMSGAFTSGDTAVGQLQDTNGPQNSATAIDPGVPNSQQK
jgi:hypothetical protein